MLIGERERANLVVQLARNFGISLSGPGARCTPTAIFYVVKYPSQAKNAHVSPLWSEMRMRILSVHRILPWSGQDHKRFTALWIQFLLATSMDSECPTPNVQPTLDDGATPSAEACDQTAATARSRASESTEARDRKLARDRARRRERLASETAEEKERRLSQRRVSISWIAPARQKCTAFSY